MASALDARQATLDLIAERAAQKTVCPSEVARVLAAGTANAAVEWRNFMPVVHVAVDMLLKEHAVQISWKGRRLYRRSGPYRIARGAGHPVTR